MSAVPARQPEAESYNAGNPEHVAAKEKASRDLAALLRSGLRHILANEASRAWVHELLEKTGVFKSSFTGNSETFMREGQRNVGLMILADIHRDHEDLYLLMCREAKARGARGFTPKRMKDGPDKEKTDE